MIDMQLNFYSGFSAVIWSSIFISVLYLFRRTMPKTNFLGFSSLIALYLCGVLRIFFPFELPHTTIIDSYSMRMYAAFWDWLFYKKFFIPLGIVSLFVSCLLLLRYFYQYFRMSRSIRKYAAPWDVRTDEQFQEIQAQSKHKMCASGHIIKNLRSPFSLGVFRKIIVLPDEAYSDEQLRYILLHEYTHFLYHDTLLKTLVEIFCIMFWWNPVVYLLKRDLEQLIELRCDSSVSRRLSKQQRAEYLRTILSALQHACAQKQTPYSTTAFSYKHADYDIKERFDAVMHGESKLAHISMVVCTLLLFVSLFRISYAFQLQPAYPAPPSTEPNTVDLNPEHTIIQKEFDGTYQLYLDGEWFLTLTEQDILLFQITDTPIADNTEIFQNIPSIHLKGE